MGAVTRSSSFLRIPAIVMQGVAKAPWVLFEKRDLGVVFFSVCVCVCVCLCVCESSVGVDVCLGWSAMPEIVAEAND